MLLARGIRDFPVWTEDGVFTVGVEEEFLLLDRTGAVAPVGGDVVRAADAGAQIKPEFMAYQVETSSRVCCRLDELRADLVWLRQRTAAAAERSDAYLVAAGMPPFRSGPVGEVTADKRYREIANRFPTATTAAGGACACQVHVGMSDRHLGVQVLGRLRPWLPTLLALTGNSSVVYGRDSGWSSFRYRMLRHWPTFRPPGVWSSAERYNRTVRSLVECGAAVGPSGIYMLARLSPRYPTIEVRVADTCLQADDAVLLAGVVRALVVALSDDVRRGLPPEVVSSGHLNTGLQVAARRGVTALVSGTGSMAAFQNRLAALRNKIMPVLSALGDTDEVLEGLRRLGQGGTGADRQRQLLRRMRNRESFVEALSEASVPVSPVG